ncbi:FUSC family protein [Shigella sonnei]
MFVCQPNYNATRHRLKLRIIGTLVGIAIGIPVLWFAPSLEGQLVLRRLLPACSFLPSVTCNTPMQRCSSHFWCYFVSNLLGEGFEVALPRVIDTLIGCAIAWAAVSYISAYWKFCTCSRMLSTCHRGQLST